MLEYRGFVAKIFYDVNTKTYYGWAASEQQIISFQASLKKDLLLAMQNSVHRILEHCIHQAATVD
jgi:predicted HicB family RNase H-like nuclease